MIGKARSQQFLGNPQLTLQQLEKPCTRALFSSVDMEYISFAVKRVNSQRAAPRLGLEGKGSSMRSGPVQYSPAEEIQRFREALGRIATD